MIVTPITCMYVSACVQCVFFWFSMFCVLVFVALCFHVLRVFPLFCCFFRFFPVFSCFLRRDSRSKCAGMKAAKVVAETNPNYPGFLSGTFPVCFFTPSGHQTRCEPHAPFACAASAHGSKVSEASGVITGPRARGLIRQVTRPRGPFLDSMHILASDAQWISMKEKGTLFLWVE